MKMPTLLVFRVVVALTAILVWSLPQTHAEDGHPGAPAPGAAAPPAWPSSPFHGVIDGATGLPIPCLCRYQGIVYRLGDTVCMNTHLGRQLTRCDLFLNNTSWVPTGVPCTTSRLPQSFASR
jgi:hypothetical protein